METLENAKERMETLSRVNKHKDQVEYVLKHFPDTRESDRLLTVAVRRLFYGIKNHLPIDVYLNREVPSTEDIKRIRAKFTNTLKMYVPRNPKVWKRRHQLEKDYKEIFGHSYEDYRTRESENLFTGEDTKPRILNLVI